MIPMIFVASCTKNTQLAAGDCRAAIMAMCRPIYGHASDWDNISDDLARNIYRHNKICAQFAK